MSEISCANSEHSDFITIQKQFFASFPLGRLIRNETFENLVRDRDAGECQKYLLNLTVNHPTVIKYPIKYSYQKAFLKFIINKLESCSVEVLEDLYTAYCNLLNAEHKDQLSYRHYVLSPSTCVILKENSNLISEGTTGLCSWQAAQATVEWAVSHRDLIDGKLVLELGSGIGLTGIATIQLCNPSKYVFSDCHPSVLKLLQQNVEVNFANVLKEHFSGNGSVEHADENELLNARVDGTDVRIVRLPWEEVSHCIADKLKPVDVILASDVVYDPSLFPTLCEALHCLLKHGHPSCMAVILCTVRNPETITGFLHSLEKFSLSFIEDETPEQNLFYYDSDVSIKVYRIHIAR